MATIDLWKLIMLVMVIVGCLDEVEARPPPWAMSVGPKGKYDGDILIDEKTLSRLQNNSGSQPETRNIIKSTTYHWPNGVIPYVFDSSFDDYPHERTIILGAIGEIHKVSCLRFVQRTSEAHYVKFLRGSGCSSYVGFLEMAEQEVSIGQGCATTGTVLHELLHVAGFFHTSSRSDRDSYVIIKTANIATGYEHNFWKYSTSNVDDFKAPYELGSLMQPPRNAWSSNGQNTIESRKGSSVVLGNNAQMTDVEIGQLNTLYQCSTSNYPVCYQSFGMQDGRITNAQLSASSNSAYYLASEARLHKSSSASGNGAWCAATSQQGQYLQIDLGSYKYIKGIATQGTIKIFGTDSWVTRYNFHFSYDASYWYHYDWWFSAGFTANYDGSSVEYNPLPVVISTRYLRIIPSEWHSEMCMRVEVYGCNY